MRQAAGITQKTGYFTQCKLGGMFALLGRQVGFRYNLSERRVLSADCFYIKAARLDSYNRLKQLLTLLICSHEAVASRGSHQGAHRRTDRR